MRTSICGLLEFAYKLVFSYMKNNSLIDTDPRTGTFRTKAQLSCEQKELKYIPPTLFQAVGQIQDFLLQKGAFQPLLLC